MSDQPPVSPIPSGTQRQQQIYTLGLTGGALSVPVSLSLLEQKAKEILSPPAFDYVAGGASGEDTVRANREAFYRWRIVPRMLRDVSERDLSVELFGGQLTAPVILGPVGVQGILHAEGELASARAGAALGLPFTLSTASSRPIEEVAEAATSAGKGVRWFQLYWGKNPELTASMLERAERAGYQALVVTLDTSMLAWRERDLQHAYLPFILGQGLGNYFSEGILHPEDAAHALDAGVDGLIVSNHGGRQVDGAIATLDALPAVVREVNGGVPVLFDGGIRRGADVFKALALGARAVLLGRLYTWGLALAGEQGVRDVVLNLLADLDLTLALSGHTSCRALDISALAESR